MSLASETPVSINTVSTTPYEGQKPGTSGLRKKVKVFQQPHYLANFVQSILSVLPENEKDSLVIGGDGRYFNKEAIQIIIKIAIANGFKHLYIGQNGILSTPAASHAIRHFKTNGGIILSASHNPAGPDEDFGIKFNNASGSPAPEHLTSAMCDYSATLTQYRIADIEDIDISILGDTKLSSCTVSIVDSVALFTSLMQTCFNFPKLSHAFSNGTLSICFDAMHAVTGPYAINIFETTLGAKPGSVINAIPLEDFGGGHPDPNLVYAKDLVAKMYHKDAPVLGAASDGDGDRNLILGPNCFVTPSDSLSIIADNATMIPQFKNGISGVARSMPTSQAVDRVAKAKGLPHYETPTGWKFFGNLLDHNKVQLCGEESFGTSGDHVREKDGIWAVLCWLTMVVESNASVKTLLEDHWNTYGRSLYCRYDYDAVDNTAADNMMAYLNTNAQALTGKTFGTYTVKSIDNFAYHDSIDGSTTENQGLRIFFTDGSRVVFRLSGTGTSGATIRMYLEQYSETDADINIDVEAKTKALSDVALTLAKLNEFTGRTAPTIIT